jgi:hypothetical protein
MPDRGVAHGLRESRLLFLDSHANRCSFGEPVCSRNARLLRLLLMTYPRTQNTNTETRRSSYCQYNPMVLWFSSRLVLAESLAMKVVRAA